MPLKSLIKFAGGFLRKPAPKDVEYLYAQCGKDITKVRIFHEMAKKRGMPITEEGIAYALDERRSLKRIHPKGLFVRANLEAHLRKLIKHKRKVKIFEMEMPDDIYFSTPRIKTKFWNAIKECLSTKPPGLLLITTETSSNVIRAVLEKAGFEINKIIEDYVPANPTHYYEKLSSRRYRIKRVIARVKK